MGIQMYGKCAKCGYVGTPIDIAEHIDSELCVSRQSLRRKKSALVALKKSLSGVKKSSRGRV